MKNKRVASGHDLERIVAGVQLARFSGARDYTARESLVLASILALVRLGFGGVRCFLDSLTASINRSSGRAPVSSRTVRRALADLEVRGLLVRRRLQCGSMLSIEFFNGLSEILRFDKFATCQVVEFTEALPLAVGCDISPPRSSCPGLDLSKDSPVDRSKLQHDPKTRAKIEAGVRQVADCSSEKKPGSKKYDPIVYTLRCVCEPRERGLVTALAESEIGGIRSGSGVDWAFWRSRWQELGIDARENLAKNEILPALLASMTKIIKTTEKRDDIASRGENRERHNASSLPLPPSGELLPFLLAVAERRSLPPGGSARASVPAVVPGPVAVPPVQVAGPTADDERPPDDPDLALLWRAARRSRGLR